MAIVGVWFVTPHAVQRYRERIDPRASYEEALEILAAESERARFVKLIPAGHGLPACALFKGRALARKAYLRLLVGRNEDGAPQLVTVLPPHANWRPPC